MGDRGPAPGTGCTVCDHRQVGAINAALASGTMSERQVAKAFKLSKDSVNRHAYRRHPGYVSPEEARAETERRRVAVEGELPDDASERDRLVRLRYQLETEIAKRPRSDLSREYRRVVARISEIDGLDGPKTLGVADVEGLPEQVARWFEALEPFPDARDAMAAATDPALLERVAP